MDARTFTDLWRWFWWKYCSHTTCRSLNRHQYGSKVQSGFSAHQCLYEAILGEHILWFQVDVILRAGPQPEWLKYAYTGSEWHGCEYPTCSAKSCDKICGGGNSGLSLRRRSKLWAVATRGELPKNLWGPSSTRPFTHVSMLSDQSAYFESDEFRDNSVTRWFEDDLQISFKLSKLGLLSPGHVSRQFALSQALPKNESLRNLNPSGMHKPWTVPWIPPRVIMELLSDPFDRIMHSIDPFRWSWKRSGTSNDPHSSASREERHLPTQRCCNITVGSCCVMCPVFASSSRVRLGVLSLLALDACETPWSLAFKDLKWIRCTSSQWNRSKSHVTFAC